MTQLPPVTDWSTDFDVLDPAYVADPFTIWDQLRASSPVAHTDRRGSTWLPTRYQDVVDLAHDVGHFSSDDMMVIPFSEDPDQLPILQYGIPPISADPPLHTWTRRLLLPWFSHRRVESYQAMTRDLCAGLVEGFLEAGSVDAAGSYAQQIPVRVVAAILGVPLTMADTFTEWVRDVLEFADDIRLRERGVEGLIGFFTEEVARRKIEPRDDLLSYLLHSDVEGEQVEEDVVLGMAALVLVAGVDTTWSAIGSSIWHLATHPDDRERMVNDPEVMGLAIEELLRAYSPVTMARVVTEDVEFQGCPMKAGDRVLMNFPAANRDPTVFEDPHQVLLDRELNRHVAFGSGIHRCAGSNLARMELRVALEEWLRRIPDFRLAEGAEVTWAGGQVRGPRQLPVVFS
jgi:cytochrome P450